MLTRDGSGFAYWRGTLVDQPESEHDATWPWMRDWALRARCRHLEELGVEVSPDTAVWAWTWFEGATRETPYLQLLPRLLLDLYERGTEDVELLFWLRDGRSFMCSGGRLLSTCHARRGARVLRALGWRDAAVRQEHEGTRRGTTDGMVALLARHGVPEGWTG